MWKWEIRPLATPKPLKRSSPKVAHAIMSWISSHMQNLFTIPYGVTFPRMREIAHQKCLLGYFLFGFFQRPTAEAAKPIFTQYVKRRGSVQGCAFSGLEDQNLTCTINPLITKNRHFWTHFWQNLESGRNPLYNGDYSATHPHYVNVVQSNTTFFNFCNLSCVIYV